MTNRFWPWTFILVTHLSHLSSFAQTADVMPSDMPSSKLNAQETEPPDVVANDSNTHSDANALSFKQELSPPQLTCLSDFAYPVGGSGIFSQDGKAFYHFSNLGEIRHKVQPQGPIYHFGLHKIDLRNFQSQILLGLKIPEVAVFATQGNPINGIIAVILNDHDNPCRKGTGQYLGISLSSQARRKKSVSILQGHGVLKLVEGPQFPYLYDIARKSLIEFDFEKMQTRSRLISVSPQEILLYADPNRQRKYTWQFATQNDENRGIVAYDSVENVAGRMKFEPGDRLLQQNRYFGVAQVPLNSNRITILELARWSGVDKTKKHEIDLPQLYRSSHANIQVHFGKKIALVSGSNREIQQRWRTVFIFAYDKPGQSVSYDSPPNHYVGYSGISPDGALIMLEIKNKLNHKSSHLAAYSMTTRKWTSIPLHAGKD